MCAVLFSGQGALSSPCWMPRILGLHVLCACSELRQGDCEARSAAGAHFNRLADAQG